MHSAEYIEEIEVTEIDKPDQKDSKVIKDSKPHETQQLGWVTGQLNLVGNQTRPNMAYAASAVSISKKDATIRNPPIANKFIKLLKINKVVSSFAQMNDFQNVSLVCFGDASFANFKCGGSHGGRLVFLLKNMGNICS